MTAALLATLEGGLLVSCQAYPGEPMRDPVIITAVALAALDGGAVGIRAQGLDDLRMIRSRTAAPLVGLVKVGHEGVFITPTVADATDVCSAGADIVALDGTTRDRPDRQPLGGEHRRRPRRGQARDGRRRLARGRPAQRRRRG